MNSELEDHRKAIAYALEHSPDPLTAYESIINTLLASQKFESATKDSIVILLEEATRQFCDDSQYLRDYRYLRLWMLYTSLVENTKVIFELLFKKGISAEISVLYQEYAAMLEAANLYVLSSSYSSIMQLDIIPGLLKPRKRTNLESQRRRVLLLTSRNATLNS
jgi:hypothetical protein